jgi:hypothetical protein
VKICKTILSLLIGTAIVATLAIIPVMAAGNYTDTNYTFNFTTPGTKYTAVREKRDKTSTYMKCESISTYPTHNDSYQAWVVGTDSVNGTNLVNVSHGNIYTFYNGTTRKMLNWVYEEGYTYGGIAGSANYMYQFTATGKWSPDSI